MSKNRNRNYENADNIIEMDGVEEMTNEKEKEEKKMSRKKKIGIGIGIGAGVLAIAAGIFGYETGKKKYSEPADDNDSCELDDQNYTEINPDDGATEDSAD